MDPDAITCTICHRHYNVDPRRDQWNATFVDGCIAAFTCPDCQTPEQNAEATVNEATLSYHQADDGRIISKAKR